MKEGPELQLRETQRERDDGMPGIWTRNLGFVRVARKQGARVSCI